MSGGKWEKVEKSAGNSDQGLEVAEAVRSWGRDLWWMSRKFDSGGLVEAFALRGWLLPRETRVQGNSWEVMRKGVEMLLVEAAGKEGDGGEARVTMGEIERMMRETEKVDRNIWEDQFGGSSFIKNWKSGDGLRGDGVVAGLARVLKDCLDAEEQEELAAGLGLEPDDLLRTGSGVGIDLIAKMKEGGRLGILARKVKDLRPEAAKAYPALIAAADVV